MLDLIRGVSCKKLALARISILTVLIGCPRVSSTERKATCTWARDATSIDTSTTAIKGIVDISPHLMIHISSTTYGSPAKKIRVGELDLRCPDQR